MSDQVHILFTMRDDPETVISYTGYLNVWVQSMLSTAHKIDQFQVMHNDTKEYIVRSRGDEIKTLALIITHQRNFSISLDILSTS